MWVRRKRVGSVRFACGTSVPHPREVRCFFVSAQSTRFPKYRPRQYAVRLRLERVG